MASYSIRDLEKLSGIKAHTLRIWEKRYNLMDPNRTNTNIRYYDDEDLKKIMNIAFLNRKGLKISHIAQLDNGEITQQISDLSNKQIDNESKIDNLVISMIELDEKRFEKIINTSVMQVGFEETILKTIYPFFEKIGILWQTGAIKPAQEHIVSNLIRQKLIVAIDGVIEPENPNPRRFILFLPEGELHEIGLLFYYYLVKKTGHKAVYLGQSVPFNDLQSVVDTRNCDSIITVFSSSISGLNHASYIKSLSETFPQLKLFISVYDGVIPDNKLPENVLRIKSATHFCDLLASLS